MSIIATSSTYTRDTITSKDTFLWRRQFWQAISYSNKGRVVSNRFWWMRNKCFAMAYIHSVTSDKCPLLSNHDTLDVNLYCLLVCFITRPFLLIHFFRLYMLLPDVDHVMRCCRLTLIYTMASVNFTGCYTNMLCPSCRHIDCNICHKLCL